jgi:phospholipase/carboxylesterase
MPFERHGDAASRLSARAGAPPPGVEPLAGGLHRLRSAWLCVPARAVPERPVPLVVLLHGAGSSGRAMVELLAEIVAEAGALLLAPDAVGRTWDVIERGFGPDVATIDATLGEVSARWRIDPRATVLGGFSDGASYALSLGLANGDRFSHLIAFSPGFVAPGPRQGRPPVYVSHGRDDRVLSIDRCSRRLVPALRAAGYEVELVEFDGGHGVPPEIARDALDWVRRTPA